MAGPIKVFRLFNNVIMKIIALGSLLDVREQNIYVLP